MVEMNTNAASLANTAPIGIRLKQSILLRISGIYASHLSRLTSFKLPTSAIVF